MDKAEAFETLYIRNFTRMKRFASNYVLSEEDAENIVQDVFGDLWEKWEKFGETKNLFGYLLFSVKNRCIDFLRHKMVSRSATEKMHKDLVTEYKMNIQALEAFPDLHAEDELLDILMKAIEGLPQQCREIFLKSKLEGKKHKEIAEEMQISVNTIETQMGIAYKKLRLVLKNLISIVILLLPL